MADMTIKQAAEFLKKTAYPFSHVTIRRAAMDGKLKATLHTMPAPYYTVSESDLLAWASDTTAHRPGRKV